MDIIPGDGQYAGVVLPTQVKSDGRHSLKLVVTGKEGQTKILIPETSRRKRATQTNAGKYKDLSMLLRICVLKFY